MLVVIANLLVLMVTNLVAIVNPWLAVATYVVRRLSVCVVSPAVGSAALCGVR